MATIEEKAKAYDEAIERAKDYYHLGDDKHKMAIDAKAVMEYIFPELKESEDERIRGAIIDHLKDNNLTEWAAWLEAQGKHANFLDKIQVGDKVTRNEDGVFVNLSQLKRVAKKDDKQGEQKPVVNDNAKEMFIKALERVEEQNNKGYKLTDCDKNSWWEDFKAYTSCTIEQKPTGWSEKLIADVFELVGLAKIVREQENDALTRALQSAMIELAKYSVVPQIRQEWSEEDEKMLKKSIKLFNEFGGDRESGAYTLQEMDCRNCADWLKSLKDRVQSQNKRKESLVTSDLVNSLCDIQDAFSDTSYEYRTLGEAIEFIRCTKQKPQWKPSGEQMEFVWKYAEQNNYDGKVFTRLYNDLKKLKE